MKHRETPTVADASVPKPLENLLYGVALRPPQFQLRNGLFTSSRLLGLECGDVPASVRIVVRGNFVGVVATEISEARRVAARLQASWENPAQQTDSSEAVQQLVAPSTAIATRREVRQYIWPNRLRWGSRADWVIAVPTDTGWQIRAPSHSPEALRRDLCALLECAPEQIEIIGAIAGGVGRTCVDDAAADAALMARETGCAVAVWLSADYQSAVDALGVAQRIEAGAVCGGSGVEFFEYQLMQAWNCAPALALLLAKIPLPMEIAPAAPVESPYDFGEQRIRVPEPAVDTYHSAQQAGLQDSFARESFVDELAETVGQDPLAFRRDHLRDARGRALLETVAAQVAWREDGARGLTPSPQQDIARGRGIAYAHTPIAGDDDDRGTRSIWIADIEVNRVTGAVQLNRIVLGQDSGAAIDTAPLRDQLQRELLTQGGSLLEGSARWDQWSADSVVDFPQAAVYSVLPAVVLEPNTSTVLRLDEGLMVPVVAALANALYHATGIRLREPPFSADRIRSAAIAGLASNDFNKSKRRGLVAAAIASAMSVLAIAWPWKGAIEPIPRPAPNLYSAATIERGRLVAAAGDCAVCHTQQHGARNTGGRPFATPFGTLYSTNITPDESTGLGNWSFAAFDRAMRQGISRDGHNLYPAFPYTAFAKISDDDMQALYAYLMSQPAVHAPTPAPAMNFPFSYRPMLAGWNLMFHDPRPFQPNSARSDLWNRGAYLAEGLGHCGACHSPRNALGAEKGGRNYFAGAVVDGWEAPPLNELSRAPVPWTEAELFQYLREGVSDQHGVAAGPMAPVVAGLSQLPEADVRAIAHYVASFAPGGDATAASTKTQDPSALLDFDSGAQLYESGCASCHEDNGLHAFTDARVPLALNTNLHSDRPDNLIRTILYGVQSSALDLPGIGAMPGFKESLSDRQIAELTGYLRHRFAPDKAAWADLDEKIAHSRAHAGSH